MANIEATDGGKAIVAGNERVIRARLSDARFFYETDLKTKLEDAAAEIRGASCSTKSLAPRPSGSSGSRGWRREFAPLVGADPDNAERAARLAKADLLTGMVGEFPSCRA